MNYLIDTSALSRTYVPAVAARIETIGPTHIRVCTIVLLEAGVSARNGDDHARQLRAHTVGTEWVTMTPEIERRAVEIQGLLATRGHHRSARLADLLIAATAEAYQLTVLHYDSDFDLVTAVTGQPCEWVVDRGSVS